MATQNNEEKGKKLTWWNILTICCAVYLLLRVTGLFSF